MLALIWTAFLSLILIPFALLQSRYLLRWLQRPDIFFYFVTRKRCVALTIDDAPCRGSTEQILATLARHRAQATFFIIGEKAVQFPDLMEMIVRGGHELGNHDLKDRMTARFPIPQVRSALTATEAQIKLYQPTGSRWFRPGVGIYTPALVRLIRGFGFRMALSDAYPHDVRFGDLPCMIDAFLRYRVQPGSIVVLHDGRPTLPTAETLNRLLTRLSFDGYTVGSLSQIETLTREQ